VYGIYYANEPEYEQKTSGGVVNFSAGAPGTVTMDFASDVYNCKVMSKSLSKPTSTSSASSSSLATMKERNRPRCASAVKTISEHKSKDVSVGAGAKIQQDLETDNLGLDGWQDKHTAVVRLYFCFEEQFKQIVENGGVKDLKSNKNGYLDKLPVG
jgi:hypothetical protein